MAIIPNVPHVAVDILVDGKPLSEYLDEDDAKAVSSNSTTKYVECKSGSKFAIRTKIPGLEYRQVINSLEVVYYLDGKWVDSNVYNNPLMLDCVQVQHAARYYENGNWKEREFMFADLVTSMLIAELSV